MLRIWLVPVAEGAHRPRKRFGQHFLRDQFAIRRLVSAIAPRAGELLIEIGPGRGALTGPLLDAGARILAIEIDRDLGALLQSKYADRRGFSLLLGDALTIDYRQLAGEGKLRLVGNLPYNLSTPLLFWLLAQRETIADMHFMLQKEVVARLAARPATKAYGRLGVMVQYHCQVEPLFEVPPAAFAPPPKVDSAVVRLRPHASPEPPAADPQLFARLVNLCFQQRRKTLRNCLRQLLPAAALESLPAPPLDTRAETLSVAELVELSNRIGDLS